MERQNLTLSLPKPLIRRAKVLAAQLDTSISALVSAQLESLVEEHDTRESASRRLIARMEKGFNLGTHGVITTTRDELHDRRH